MQVQYAFIHMQCILCSFFPASPPLRFFIGLLWANQSSMFRTVDMLRSSQIKWVSSNFSSRLVHPGQLLVELLRHGFEATLIRFGFAVALVRHEAFHVFGEADLPMDLGLLMVTGGHIWEKEWKNGWLTLKEIVTSLNLTINWGSYIGEFANKKLINMEFPGRSSSRLHPLCQLTAQRPQVTRNLSRAWQPQDLIAGTLYFIFPTLSELPSRAASEDFATWILSETNKHAKLPTSANCNLDLSIFKHVHHGSKLLQQIALTALKHSKAFTSLWVLHRCIPQAWTTGHGSHQQSTLTGPPPQPRLIHVLSFAHVAIEVQDSQSSERPENLAQQFVMREFDCSKMIHIHIHIHIHIYIHIYTSYDNSLFWTMQNL